MPTLADVVAILDAAYDPRRAAPWDAVGLVCGDPAGEVRRVLFAVDPVDAVSDEAIAWRADLLVTHHPLLLRPVHGVAATTFKGRTVHRLITHGVALLTAHTNADTAAHGVSDALARALGLTVTGPILPEPDDPARGIGRLGTLPAAEPLSRFVERVAAALPATRAGVRAAGDPDRPVRHVAVCGGSGDDPQLLAAVRAARADAYVTADLRHHPASEAIQAGQYATPDAAPALVDVSHWAGEWPWLADAAAVLATGLGGPGVRGTVETRVSTLVTDPWTLHVPQDHA